MDFNYHTHFLEENAFISLSLDEIKTYPKEKLNLINSKIFLSLHPWDLPTEKGSLSKEFIALASSNLIYGIGEIGADKNSKIPINIQLYYLEELLKLANKLEKPIQLHVVKSWNAVQILLKKYPQKKIFLHGFIGKIEYLKNLLDFGIFVSLNPKMINRKELYTFLQNEPNYLNSIGLENDDKLLNINELYKEFHAKF